MIGSLRGMVLERTLAGEVLVEVGGVGYRVGVPTGTLAKLEPGGPAFLFTHLHVREEALVLFGFVTREERDTFEALLGATGVGPKLALAMLSVHSPATLRAAVHGGDAESLTMVPGVGKRTAQRLLVELVTRLDGGDDLVVGRSGAGPRGEVRAALEGLGYGPEEIREAMREVPEEGSVEILLRDALRVLGRARGGVGAVLQPTGGGDHGA